MISCQEPFLVKLRSNPHDNVKLTIEEEELLKYYKRAISNEFVEKHSISRMDKLESSFHVNNVNDLLNNLLIFDGNFSEKMKFIEAANLLIELKYTEIEAEEEFKEIEEEFKERLENKF